MEKYDVYAKMAELGITLPKVVPEPATLSLSRFMTEDLLYVSGTGPNVVGEPEIHGKVPVGVSESEGIAAARAVALNALAVIENEIGDLNKIDCFVKLIAFVACDDPKFSNQHIVANGTSQLLIDIFGEKAGKAARSAVGVYSLPGDIPVEVEMIVKLKPEKG